MKLADTPVVLASGNRGKIREFASLLRPRGLRIRSQSEFGVTEVAETATTFVENALIKARHASQLTGLPAIADDSGLAVDGLHGAPGVYSARYAGDHASDAENVAKVLAGLADIPDMGQRSARFHCIIVLLREAADPIPLICHGVWEGCIQTRPTGNNGFGYDPIFHVPTHGCSAAELDAETKNATSHRGRALQELLRKLRGDGRETPATGGP